MPHGTEPTTVRNSVMKVHNAAWNRAYNRTEQHHKAIQMIRELQVYNQQDVLLRMMSILCSWGWWASTTRAHTRWVRSGRTAYLESSHIPGRQHGDGIPRDYCIRVEGVQQSSRLAGRPTVNTVIFIVCKHINGRIMNTAWDTKQEYEHSMRHVAGYRSQHATHGRTMNPAWQDNEHSLRHMAGQWTQHETHDSWKQSNALVMTKTICFNHQEWWHCISTMMTWIQAVPPAQIALVEHSLEDPWGWTHTG
jgi:hypothetical protein